MTVGIGATPLAAQALAAHAADGEAGQRIGHQAGFADGDGAAHQRLERGGERGARAARRSSS